MSLYQVQKLLFHLCNVDEVRERFERDRDRLLDAYQLTPEERRAIVRADVGTLYAMGAHPLLLAPFGGRAGLGWPDYIAALAAAEPHRSRGPERR